MSVIEFPGREKSGRNVRVDDEEDEAAYSYRPRPRAPFREGSMQTVSFRSYDLTVQSDEADLVRDASLDIDKAQTKLAAIRQRLRGVQEQAAARIELLSTAETKLAAAIVAALLSSSWQR